MATRYTIVGIGEALFDFIRGDQHPGGAPLNFAVHANQLIRRHNGRGVMVSRIGQDSLGESLRKHLEDRQMTCQFIQSDPDRATGRVYVNMNASGEPEYDIVENAAWDMLWFDPDLEDLAQTCDAVCFGTLAQRDAQSRNSIYRFLDTCRHAVRLFDVNLRQDYYNQRIIRKSCELAQIVKLNRDELAVVMDLLGLDGDEADSDSHVRALIREFKLEMVVLTREKEGTRLYTSDQVVDGQPVDYHHADHADSVGAGDACAAAVIVGRVLRRPLEHMANLANLVGGYVAAQAGAAPILPDEILDRV